jgi:DNA-directed RNA polymerase II subunit RPB1
MSHNSKYYNENIKNIIGVEFDILTNEQVKKISAVKNEPFGINIPESYDNYEPKKGGLVDLRMGTCDIYLPCTTCGLNTLDCPGHFGHTELAEPVFHFGFMTHLVSILKCICLKCSNILIDKSDINVNKFMNKNGKRRYNEIKELVKNIKFCNVCGTPVPKIREEIKENPLGIKILLEKKVSNIDEEAEEITKTIKEYLNPRQCYNILRNISNTDCFLLGFNYNNTRPENMIITRFPIPPVIIRPTSKIDFQSSSTMEDSLTLKISDIINTNNKVRNLMNKTSNYADQATLLQYNIAIYFDNTSSSLPQSVFKSGNKPIKSISERIKTKEGRVRFNLMGKRVDFSARTVITGDPNIGIDEVGIPLKVAKELTIPEEVTPKNIKYLTKLVKNGKDNYPGANFVLKIIYVDGKEIIQKIDLKYRKKNIKLSYGDVVERHIVNGDYVLFNRQPTLHKPSMMGHKIHVLNRDDINTFRMNVSVAAPYNADFDGDEMNIHLPQSIQARNELERIANVKYQIIGAKNSNPIIGCVQDSIAGAFLMSKDNEIDYNTISNCLCVSSVGINNNIPKFENITGNKLFSYIIPEGINSIKKSGNDIFFQIKNGELLQGILDKSQLSTAKNSIIHFIWDKYGPNETKTFIDDTQKIVLSYLYSRGLSVGIKDCIITDDMNNKVIDYINTNVLNTKYMITQYENSNEDLDKQIIEGSIIGKLGSINANLGKMLMGSVDKDNNLYTLIKSGARGKDINFAQITGCVGQISVEGERIKKRITGRTLPIFHQNDDTPEARGFIKSNFLNGLNGYELFYNSFGSREGLIDTAIRTAETGYIQRKLIKAMEDLMVYYDGTIRTINGNIVQYLYGESGIDQLKQTEVKLKLIEMNNSDIVNSFVFSKIELDKLEKKFNKKFDKFNNHIKNQMEQFRDDLRTIYTKSKFNYRVLEDNFMMPVNIFRITQEYTNDKPDIYLDPEYIITNINDLLEDYNDRLIILMKKDSKMLKDDEYHYKYLFRIGLFEYIAPKKCIFEYGLSKEQFDNMIKDIKLSYSRSLVEPGEMVGIIAAQSIGEPTSQMTLNTKHITGVATQSSANMGVPRIKEILSYSKTIKTPQMTIYFNKNIHTDKKQVNIINSSLKHLTIGELIDSGEIIYDIDGNNKLDNKLKNDNVKNPFYINNNKVDLNLLPFVIRLEMNMEKMLDKEITLLDIKTKFISYWYNNFSDIKNVKKIYKDIISNINALAILSNNKNIIHIKFRMSNFNYSYITTFLKTIVLDVITLKGMDGINNVDMRQEMFIFNDDDKNKKVDKEYVITTDGININKLLTIKNIDHKRTTINDITTVYKRYGIEAARQVIKNELNITFNAGGSSEINNAHMSLLVDLMTHLGEVISIARHGLVKIDSEPLAKASFEQTMEHFVNAAIFNEKDNIKSVSSRVMVGRTINGGTSAFELLLDTDKLIRSEFIEDETGGRSEFVELQTENLFADIINTDIKQIDFMIPE